MSIQENPSVTKKGFIILANSRESRLNNFDGKWALAACSSGDRDFPIRWREAHVCHANAVFPFVASAVKAVLSPKQRKSFILHNGSDERVLQSLSEYSLPIHCIPTDLGGTLQVSTDAFIKERLLVECDTFDTNKPHEVVSSAGDGVDVYGQELQQDEMEISRDNMSHPGFFAESCHIMSDDDAKLASESVKTNCPRSKSMIPNNIRSSQTADVDMDNYDVEKIQAEFEQKQKSAEPNLGGECKRNIARKKEGKRKQHPGRTGDPRMNRAVQAKLNDSGLSLVDALVAGGFIFPDMNIPGIKLSTVKDTDDVTVYQRRNQLLRRLRLVKEKVIKM